MNAAEMRKLTVEANQQRELRKKEDAATAKAEALRAAASTKKWWLTQGVGQLLDKVKQAAGEGKKFYEEVIDVCPDYVVDYIRSKGFEVTRTTAKRGVRLGQGDGDSWDRYYAHVVLIRW